MATMQNAYNVEGFRVVHPLEDAPEQKCQTEGLGPISMTRSVRFSLLVLRGYLILMTLLLVWHVLALAGVFHNPQ